MAGRLEGKIALVTGSTAGCGRACAIRFAAEGARVMVTGRNEAAGADIVRTICEAGGEANFFRADLGIEGEVSALVSATVRVFGGLDILVNNAAPTDLGRRAAPVDGAIAELTTERMEAMWRPALYSYFWACRFGIEQMVRQGTGGSVVNISSIATLQSMNGMDAYTAAKGAISSTTRSLATQYGQHGIRVNGLLLGLIVTSASMRAMVEHEVIGPRIKALHLTRLGRPDDMANAALFLASDEAAFITGSLIVADGGLSVNSPLNSLFAR